MRDQAAAAALIERLVARARIPGRAKREDLRRELWTHFEEANGSTDVSELIRRFGAETLIGDSLRDVYRWDYALWYLAKIAAAIAASVAAALLIQVVVNLRLEVQAEALRLAPAFSRGAGMSVVIVLGLVTVWEAARQPFNRSRAAGAIGAYVAICVVVRVLFLAGAGALVTAAILVGIGSLCSRLERWPPRLVVMVGAFAMALYLDHALISVTFGIGRALMAGVILGAVCSSTVAILGRLDHAFGNVLGP